MNKYYQLTLKLSNKTVGFSGNFAITFNYIDKKELYQ